MTLEQAIASIQDDELGESFFRSQGYQGALLPACLTEEFVPFVEDEPYWTVAGAEKPEMLVRWEDEQARRSQQEEEPSRE